VREDVFVAQVVNLLFRRLAVGVAFASPAACGLPIRATVLGKGNFG
jgi:hypothetical protein